MFLLLKLSWQSLTRRRLIFLFMVLAVSFALAFQWPNTANMTGYGNELIRKFILNGNGHLILKPRSQNYAQEISESDLRKMLGSEPYLSYPRLRIFGIIVQVDGRRKNLAVEMVGVGEREWRLHMESLGKLKKPPAMLIGKRVLRASGSFKSAKLGTILSGSIYQARLFNYAVPTRGYWSQKQITMPLKRLQKIVRMEKISEVMVMYRGRADINSVFMADKEPGWFEPEMNWRKITWWKMDGGSFVYGALRSIGMVQYIASIMTMVAASLPLLALLFIGVMYDRDEIALLGCLGFERYYIFSIYLVRGVILSFIGVLIGSLGGWGLIQFFIKFPVYQTEEFTIVPGVNPDELGGSILAVVIVTIFSGLFPAWRAANLDPVKIFRNL